jgi:hypothetical protein
MGSAIAQNNLITNNGIDVIHAGDPAHTVLTFFQKPHQIIDKKKQYAGKRFLFLKTTTEFSSFPLI